MPCVVACATHGTHPRYYRFRRWHERLQGPYLGGTQYTIADTAVWPWYGALAKGLVYEADEFLQVADYKNVQRWTDAIAGRPAVKRGRMVNRIFGDPASQLRERHEASDFDT